MALKLCTALEKEKWFRCPICGQKLLKISSSAYSNGLYIKCKGKLPSGKKCNQEVEITITKGADIC